MHKLDSIAENIKVCEKCKLCETRTKAVPGKGNFDADVIFVGEAPGRNEDIHGEPFVGAAGKRLDMILEDTGIDREDVYIRMDKNNMYQVYFRNWKKYEETKS